MIEFTLESDFIPLIQLLKATRLAETGGEAQLMVAGGKVKVNGAIEYRKRLKVKTGDMVTFAGKKIKVI